MASADVQTLDVDYELEQIAKGLSEADAARVRTLIYLAGRRSAEAILPEPMSDDEVTHRLERLMRAAGLRLTRIAYLRAHKHRVNVKRTIESMGAADLNIDMRKLPTTLKQLYKRYPEIKCNGFPKGYPISKSILTQVDWIKKMAIKIEVERAASENYNALRELDKGPVKDHLRETPERSEQGLGADPEGTAVEAPTGADQHPDQA